MTEPLPPANYRARNGNSMRIKSWWKLGETQASIAARFVLMEFRSFICHLPLIRLSALPGIAAFWFRTLAPPRPKAIFWANRCFGPSTEAGMRRLARNIFRRADGPPRAVFGHVPATHRFWI